MLDPWKWKGEKLVDRKLGRKESGKDKKVKEGEGRPSKQKIVDHLAELKP